MKLHFGEHTLDADRHELFRGDVSVHLSPKAFNLLQLLATSYPSAVSKADILSTVWPDTFVTEANIPILIKEIRTALGDDARKPSVVRTVFGHGYALASEVSVEQGVAQRILSSIAVLPFANESGADLDYVSDGISESLINDLARRHRFRVVPRSTSFRLGASGEEPAVIGRKLHVDCVLSGRVRVVADELLVQVDLVDVVSEAQLWGESFHRRMTSLFDLPGMIAGEITRRLPSEVTTQGKEPDVEPRNGEAYRLYLLGRHFGSRRENRSLGRALECFAEAAALDPAFAEVHAATARAYVTLGTRDLQPPGELFPIARANALHALELDPELADAHTALAAVQELFEWEWDAAERSHLRAIELDPRSATPPHWFALHLARRGRHDEARPWMEKALGLEPASAVINTNAALIAYLARDFERSVSHASVALDLDPASEGGLLITGAAMTQVEPARAAEGLEHAIEVCGRQPHIVACLACACAVAGQMEKAHALRDELERGSREGYVSGANRALAAVACGDHEHAIEMLELAAEARSPWLSYLRGEPRMEAVRSHATFQRLEAMIGF